MGASVQREVGGAETGEVILEQPGRGFESPLVPRQPHDRCGWGNRLSVWGLARNTSCARGKAVEGLRLQGQDHRQQPHPEPWPLRPNFTKPKGYR